MNTQIVIEILLFSLLPLVTMVVGGFVGMSFKVSPKFRSTLLHLAAGVIFAVVAIELLPAIVEKHNITTTSIGFFAGLFVMLLIKYITHKSEKQHKETDSTLQTTSKVNSTLPWGLLFGIAVDIVLDGILLGVGFAAGQSEGMLLGIALSLEILVLGLVVSTELKAENLQRKLIMLIIFLLGISIVLGAFIGALLLNFVSESALTGVLAFGLSALIYLVTEELLVEAHENTDTPFSTAVFFVGFFIFLLISISH